MRPPRWRGLSLLLMMACSRGPEPEGVLFSGCMAVLPGRTCVAPEGKVVVWVPPGLKHPELRVAGEVVPITGEEIDGGVKVQVSLTEGPIELRAGGRWRMDVVPEVAGLSACVDGGEDELQALPDGPAGLCLSRRASRMFASGDRDMAVLGWRDAVARLSNAGWSRESLLAKARFAWSTADDPRSVGMVLPEPEDRSDAVGGVMSWYARGQMAAATGDHRASLNALRRGAEIASRTESPDIRAELDERIALVEARLGRPVAAVYRYDSAFALQSGRPCWAVERALAYAWGLELLREEGVVLEGLPSSRVLGRAPDPTALLRLAARSLDDNPQGCRGRKVEADLWVNQAMDALSRGELAPVAGLLAAAQGADRSPDTDRWMYELRARFMLASGRVSEAEAAWRLVEELSEQSGDTEMRWRALDGLGRAALVGGGPEAALIPWGESRELFVEQAVMVPLRHGRGTFLDQRSPVVAAHTRTLLELGRPAEAFEVGRSWRSQLLATTWLVDRIGALDDTGRRQWDGVVADYGRLRAERQRLIDRRRAAPADELPRLEVELKALEQRETDALDTGMSALSLGTDIAGRPRERGESRLLALRAPRAVGQGALAAWARGAEPASEPGYLPIVQDDRGIVAGTWVSEADLASRPGRLLDALEGRLDVARSVTLLLPGVLEPLDVQAASVGGAPLIRQVPVTWSVDRAANAVVGDTGAPRRALVIGDPGGGLAGAREEATWVAARLEALGWQVTRLSGADARLHKVLAALGGDGVELLHFAGHGELGEDAWDARLVLAGGTVLGVQDVLALKHPPRIVVLAGCETARTEGIGIAGMGLAQAFINAGSDAVVATARKVDDTLARRFSEGWYADDLGLSAPALGFQRVVSHLAEVDPAADWAGFRLITR